MRAGNLRGYYEAYIKSSRTHADNVLKYGPATPFGYPEPLPEQLKRVEFIASHAEGLTLDIGCDSGYILDRCGGGVGVDISQHRLGAAKHWYPELNLVQAAAEHLPFRKAFNTVVAAELLEHVLDLGAVLSQAHEVLEDGGRLVVTVPDEVRGKSHLNPEHLRKFTEGQLRNLLLGLFDIESTEYIGGDYPAWCVLCKRVE